MLECPRRRRGHQCSSVSIGTTNVEVLTMEYSMRKYRVACMHHKTQSSIRNNKLR